MATAMTQSARQASLARRRALTTTGKAAIAGNTAKLHSTGQMIGATTQGVPARQASRARREAMSKSGKAGVNSRDRTRQEPGIQAPAASKPATEKDCGCKKAGTGGAGQTFTEATSRAATPVKQNVAHSVARAASLARREATSSQGKAGLNATSVAVQSAQETGNAMSSREQARQIREQRSRQGKSGETQTESCGQRRMRNKNRTGAAADATWKVGASETMHGQTMTGTIVDRSQNVTGNEPSICRAITGTNYMGSDVYREFCNGEPAQAPRKVSMTSTMHGNTMTGNYMGPSNKVTGDEAGSSRRLTGSQYVQSTHGKTSSMTGVSSILSGRVSGNMAGQMRNRSGKRNQSATAGGTSVSDELAGNKVTGTRTERSGRVTGDEPGTCKALTGTPYISSSQLNDYCEPELASLALARARKRSGRAGAVMTGLQPGIEGKLTGAGKGACEEVSGTPYVGADQYAEACPAVAADANSPDFPQAMGETPWGRFSVTEPSGGAQQERHCSSITGSRYESGHITGPFGLGSGKVTGTEDARFGDQKSASMFPAQATTTMIDGRVKSRVTGEGMDTSQTITGDDWGRNEHVTGTEGASAIKRNPTLHTGHKIPAAAMKNAKRNDALPEPVSKVTGGSGNTDKGSLITYSGGARG